MAGEAHGSDDEAQGSPRKRQLEAFLQESFSAELLPAVRSPLTKHLGKGDVLNIDYFCTRKGIWHW